METRRASPGDLRQKPTAPARAGGSGPRHSSPVSESVKSVVAHPPLSDRLGRDYARMAPQKGGCDITDFTDHTDRCPAGKAVLQRDGPQAPLSVGFSPTS